MRDRSSQGTTRQRTTPALRRARARRREGAVAVTVVLMFGVILGMMALAIDAGHIYKVRTEAQNAADATALAAAVELDGTATGITDARDKAVDFAASNRIYSGAAVVAAEDVVFGRWSPATAEFTELAEDEVSQINAVRVRTTPAAVDVPFAGVFGRDETNVSAIAIATAGGAAAECSFPLVLADCMPSSSGMSAGNCGMCLQFQSNGNDTAGWSNLGSGGNDPNTFGSLIKSGCSNLIEGCTGYNGDTSNTCDGTCTAPTVDESIQLNNGNFFNEGGAAYGEGNCGASLNQPCEVIKEILLRESDGSRAVDAAGRPIDVDGQQAFRGKFFSVTVPLIDDDRGEEDDGDCDPQFSDDAPIEGYATIDIFSIQCVNNGGGTGKGKGKGGEDEEEEAGRQDTVIDPDYMAAHASELSALLCNPPSGNHILARVHCDATSSEPGGGGMVGSTAYRPRLVH